MGTGTAVSSLAAITAAKMNQKLETVTAADIESGVPRLIERKVLAVAGTTFDFTGLDINTDHTYELVLVGDNNTANGSEIALEVNGDTIATNYYYEELSADGSTVASGRTNSNRIGYMYASDPIFAHCKIVKTPDGNVKAISTQVREAASTIIGVTDFYAKVATVTNITQLTIVAAQAFKIGSSATLYAFP